MSIKRLFRNILLIPVFLLPAAAPLVFYFQGSWYAFFDDYSVGMWLGILSYVCFLNTLILSARIPLLDRMFGHDRVMVFHGYMALLGLIFAFLHHNNKETYFTEENLQINLGSWALTLFIAVAAVTLILMVQGRIHRISILDRLRRKVTMTGFADYSRLKLFHNIVSAGAVCAAVHVLTASTTRAVPWRMIVTGSYGGLAIAVWIYHKFIRVFILSRNRWTIESMSHPGKDITEFTLTRGTPLNRHLPGQFAYLRIRSKECGFEEHPFTISSAPGNPVTFTIKNLGDYTSKLKNVSGGTEVLLDGPYGTFTPRLTEKPLLFIAGGIGITPFLSILGEWRKKGFSGRVTIVWSCGTSEDLVHREFFDTCAEEDEQFTFIPVLTREADKQRITKEFLESLPGGRPAKVYFCGPESLRRACTGFLREMGIPAAAIHFEKFS